MDIGYVVSGFLGLSIIIGAILSYIKFFEYIKRAGDWFTKKPIESKPEPMTAAAPSCKDNEKKEGILSLRDR